MVSPANPEKQGYLELVETKEYLMEEILNFFKQIEAKKDTLKDIQKRLEKDQSLPVSEFTEREALGIRNTVERLEEEIEEIKRKRNELIERLKIINAENN